MGNPPAGPVEELHPYTNQLTEPAAVRRYLQDIPLALLVNDVQRIRGGMINFVYRLVLDQADRVANQSTAILKYSAPYVAESPNIVISPTRQIFEARAFKAIPWRQFHYSSTPFKKDKSVCSRVTLPEVYFEDFLNHVTIMQDCSTGADEESHPEKEANPFRFFCEHLPKSEIKYQIARTIGSLLGSFLAQVHDWGQCADSQSRAVELFGANNDSMKLLTQVHVTDFFTSLGKIDYQISPEQQRAVESRIQQLELAMHAQRDTVIVGDFQLGNILLSFGKAGQLSNISVIDWEFVTMGPSFVDIGNFVGEVFCTSYLNSVDSTYVEVLDSFMLAYRAFGVPVDVSMAMIFVGAGIIESLPRRLRYSNRGTAAMARKCADHALGFIVDADQTESATGENDPFASLSRILRDSQSIGE